MTIEDQLGDRFSKQLDLPAYLAQQGYEFSGVLRGHGSCVGQTVGLVMTATNPETNRPSIIVLAKDPVHAGWTYADASDTSHRGNVIDYLAHNEGLSRASAIERIAACLDRNRRDIPQAIRYREQISLKTLPARKAEQDHDAFVHQHREAIADLSRLGIRSQTIIDSAGTRSVVEANPERFPTIKVRGDVVKFVEEAPKLWLSPYKPTDKRLVLVERPIDAISHAQRHKDPHACYVAVGDVLCPSRKQQLAHLLAELPPGMSVVAGFGRDHGGRQLTEDARALAPRISMESATPSFGARWSDQMQLEARHMRSMAVGRNAGLSR